MDALQGHNQCVFVTGHTITLSKSILHGIVGKQKITMKISSINMSQQKTYSKALPILQHCPVSGLAKATRGIWGGQDTNGSWDGKPDGDVHLNLEEIQAPCKYADTEVAITHDDDWIDLIGKLDNGNEPHCLAALQANTNPSSHVALPAPESPLQHMPGFYPPPRYTHGYNNSNIKLDGNKKGLVYHGPVCVDPPK
ncbi:hypothetical protein IMY05_C4900000100 [Salix suchowensis]|nr:hypothetical protein IMY05_C4900000100 [Salix suchowensis]